MSAHRGRSEQPSAMPLMTQANQNASSNMSSYNPNSSGAPTHPENTFVRHASEKVIDGAEEQVGEQAVSYATENAPQDIDDAKAKAQGLWAKYCGCFSSVA